MTLKLKEGDVKSTDVCDKALAVINSWRQSSSHACISTLCHALHNDGLQRIDESFFGHIRDLTLTDLEAAALSFIARKCQTQQAKAAALQVRKFLFGFTAGRAWNT